jgi:hypothetical protein
MRTLHEASARAMTVRLEHPFLPLSFLHALSPRLDIPSHFCLVYSNDRMISLNFELLTQLDNLIVHGFQNWVDAAPDPWKVDRFLTNNSPIVVTSRYGQNAAIALEGNRRAEAAAWDRDRDYSKIAFLTVAIATSIKYASLVVRPLPCFTSFPSCRCTEVHRMEAINVDVLIDENRRLYDGPDRRTRLKLSSRELWDMPLLDDEGREIPIYNSKGVQVPRRAPVQNPDQPPCGVLINLKSIQGLFNPDTSSVILDDATASSSQYEDPFVRVEGYPLGFLKTAGNVKATGIPHCFYPLLTNINKSVRRNHEALEEDDDPEAPYLESTYRAVKPVSSQFYNYMAHRVASRAGRHDAQQGTVTAAISGAYASTDKDRKVAKEKQKLCKRALPSEMFRLRINSVGECPNSCRAELVYSVDVRALNLQSGS